MIYGKVARIVSSEEVIINVGQEDRVTSGMEFVIYAEGDHITDPGTSEDLGAIEFVKGRVVVTHVMPKMSRAKVKIESPSPLGIPVTTLSAFNEILLGRAQRTYLKVDRDQVKPLPSSKDVVQVGDLVRLV
jgi:hypothetical protein